MNKNRNGTSRIGQRQPFIFIPDIEGRYQVRYSSLWKMYKQPFSGILRGETIRLDLKDNIMYLHGHKYEQIMDKATGS